MHKNKEEKEILPFVPALSVHYKKSFNERMESHTSKPLLCQIFNKPPIISLRKEKKYGKGNACYSQNIKGIDVQPVTRPLAVFH